MSKKELINYITIAVNWYIFIVFSIVKVLYIFHYSLMQALGKFVWGKGVFFSQAQFRIRLASESYHAKKDYTVATLWWGRKISQMTSKMHPKRSTGCGLFRFHYSFIYKALKIDFLWSDMANNLQLQSPG